MIACDYSVAEIVSRYAKGLLGYDDSMMYLTQRWDRTETEADALLLEGMEEKEL